MSFASAEPVYTLSSWGRRVMSGLIDYGIPGFVLWVTLFARWWIFLFAMIGATAFQLWNQYQQGLTGQSIGKKTIGLVLVRESDAQPMGVGPCIGRWLTHLVDSLPCGAGYFNPLWDPRRQTFADKIFRTVVIEVP